MSQYGQVKKSFAFRGCAKLVCWLHIARTENPDTPQTHPSASDFHEYHSDSPQTSPRHPPDISREHDMPTDNKRLQQAPKDTARHTQAAHGSVLGCLAVSVGFCCCFLACHIPWRCLRVVWEMSGGCLSDIHGNWRRSDVFVEYLGSQSLQYGANTLFWHSPERKNFFHLSILRH